MFINLGLSYETHFLKKILKTSQGLALNQTYFFLWLNSLRCRGFFFSYDFFVLRPEGTHITYLSKRFDSWYYLKIFFSIQAVCAGFNPSIFLELTRVGFFLSLEIKRKILFEMKMMKNGWKFRGILTKVHSLARLCYELIEFAFFSSFHRLK